MGRLSSINCERLTRRGLPGGWAVRARSHRRRFLLFSRKCSRSDRGYGIIVTGAATLRPGRLAYALSRLDMQSGLSKLGVCRVGFVTGLTLGVSRAAGSHAYPVEINGRAFSKLVL